MKSYLEQAFGRGDVTSARMQAAIREWLNLYYGTQSPGEDAADRLQNLGQLVNNVKNYCDQHGEEASLEGYLEDIALISDMLPLV